MANFNNVPLGEDSAELSLRKLTSLQAGGGGGIPENDYIDIGYHGTTNNIATVVYKLGGSGGTTVATLTIAYVGGVPTTDDARIDTITKS
jgi:hypothetical protein